MSETATGSPVVLSFDVEEHHRIEAAAGVQCSDDLKRDYAGRMEARTREILGLLAERGTPATFFIVGEIATTHPKLVRDIAAAGHEVASHSWDHQRVHRFTPDMFAADLRRSKDVLEQASGQAVVGFRAPTFSVVRQTGWAIDVLADVGMRYDSSVFPVLHDRYGIPDAPRTPFLASGRSRTILELPPATYRVLGRNLPVAGGGYFRLFPPAFLRAGVKQLSHTAPPVGMLYFHPWEFDPTQPKLPLKRLSRWRTYVGVRHSMKRLAKLIATYHGRFRRAVDVAADLETKRESLPRFPIPGEAS